MQHSRAINCKTQGRRVRLSAQCQAHTDTETQIPRLVSSLNDCLRPETSLTRQSAAAHQKQRTRKMVMIYVTHITRTHTHTYHARIHSPSTSITTMEQNPTPPTQPWPAMRPAQRVQRRSDIRSASGAKHAASALRRGPLSSLRAASLGCQPWAKMRPAQSRSLAAIYTLPNLSSRCALNTNSLTIQSYPSDLTVCSDCVQ